MAIDHEKLNRILAEFKFRSDTIRRLYPGVRIRTCAGGNLWDPAQPCYVLVILPVPKDQDDGEHHNVLYDEELTKLQRAASAVLAPSIDEALKRQPLDQDSPALRLQRAGILFSALATSEETWSGEAKDLWEKLKRSD